MSEETKKPETGMNNPYLKGHQIGITPLVLGTYVLKYLLSFDNFNLQKLDLDLSKITRIPL